MACETFELDTNTLVEIFSEDDETLEVEVVDCDEQVVNIAGYTAVLFGMKENVEDDDYVVGPLTCDHTTEGANGIASVEIPASATEDIDGTFVAEFEGEDSGGKKTTFIQFGINVLRDVVV
jgi:hypothetical protein